MELRDLAPLEGGWSAETFSAEADGRKVVVRRYAAGQAPGLDAAVLRRAQLLVPVPEVLEVAPGRLVTTYVDGVQGDLLLPTLDDARVAVLGADVGRIVSVLAATELPRAGAFVDEDLDVEPFVGSLPQFAEEHRTGWAHWTDEEAAGLFEVAAEAEVRLTEVGRCSLVHGDLNPKNLIVDPESLTVAAVLDWEFAHVGSPYTDLGNAIRFDRRSAWVEAVVTTYAGRVGEEARLCVDLARRADLWALLDLSARRGQNPVADRAHALLRAIAATRDVHASPDLKGREP